VTRDANLDVVAAHLFFADSYAATKVFEYSITNGPLLIDLTLDGVDALKVSFSYISSSNYYNIFILEVLTAGGTNVMRYFYDASSGSNGANEIAVGRITKHYSLALSAKTNTLFRDKLENDEIQIMTFEYACTCSVIEISEFICFGASLECTVAVQNYNTDCTVEAGNAQTNQWTAPNPV
jgi:hypothetical protein